MATSHCSRARLANGVYAFFFLKALLLASFVFAVCSENVPSSPNDAHSAGLFFTGRQSVDSIIVREKRGSFSVFVGIT